MSHPYLYPLCCAACGQRMDPNGDDNLHTEEGASVCSQGCLGVDKEERKPHPFDKAFPMLAEVNAMLRNISIGPKP